MSSPLEQLLGGVALRGKAKQQESIANLATSGKVIGIYFSAHWCPPCRGFTPQLAEFYQKMKSKFEVIFVSSDKDEQQWLEYFSEMPWLALPYLDRDRKAKLAEKYSVHGIPTLVLVDSNTAQTINQNARTLVVQNPSGDGFPWKS